MKKLGWWWGSRRGGWQTKCIMGDMQMANIQRLMYRAHVLMWPAAIQIYCDKRKHLDRKKQFNLHRTGVGPQNRRSLWTGSLFGERVKKSKGEEREKVRACRHTFGTAIPPSGLVIADHLSARLLSVTWIHWDVINFTCKKEVSIIGNTQLLPCTKMLLFSNEFFLWWVDYALEGLVLVEKMWFLPLISYLGVVTCILIFCGYCFWSGWFAVWCKNIHCG